MASIWTEAELQKLVDNKIEENLELDYKSSSALANPNDRTKDEISKDVSSFANSAGGVIVYGVAEDKTTHRAVKLDDGVDPRVVTKEWLEQTILSNIHPRLNAIVITPVNLDQHRPGCVAYVVQIPQSGTCHQARDRRYYKRRNFLSEPMLDYEIRDTMNRVTKSRLNVVVSYVVKTSDSDRHVYDLVVRVTNPGPIRVRDLAIDLCLSRKLFKSIGRDLFERPLDDAESEFPAIRNRHDYRVIRPRNPPQVLFPQEVWSITRDPGNKLRYEVDRDVSSQQAVALSAPLFWRLFADDNIPEQGYSGFDELNCY